MKKIPCIFLVLTFLLAATMGYSTPVKAASSKAGTYHGTAVGYHGKVNVTVRIDDKGTIRSVDVDNDHHETKGVGTVATEKVSKAIVKKQALDVDGVTGATLTGDAVCAATADALQKAGIDPAFLGFVPVVKKPVEKITFNPAAMPKKAPVTGSIIVTDARNRKVRVNLPVSTYAISTMDVIDYVIPLLGRTAFDKLVASGQDGGGGIQRYARLYTPIVGNYLAHFGQISEHNAPFDLEMILARNPDVLIVNSAMSAHRNAKIIEAQLSQVGIPIVMIDVPGNSITTAAQNTLKLLGKIFQKEERAAEVITFMDKQYAMIASKKLGQRTDKPAVYYEKSGYSEVFGHTQSSKRTGWGTLIAVAGGDNIADPFLLSTFGGKGGSGALDPEIVLQADPDFIMLSGSGAGWMNNFPDDPAKKPSFDIVNRTGWKSLNAVKKRNIYELAHSMNRSIYSFYACLKMASIFYPNEFAGVNPETVLDEFFKKFMLLDSSITGWVYRYDD
jgi:iron complex transport system substrate-binding protein